MVLRRLVGVKEDILDWVPEERPRYTRLGLIVLNTGVLAGFSMTIAMATVGAVSPWLLVPLGLFWGLIIITVDSWLITSTNGSSRHGRLRVFAPRLVLSVLLGLVIAEPLVLWVFGSSITAEIKEFRKAEVEGYQSTLRVCNPATGGLNQDPACDGYRLNPGDTPQALESQLEEATAIRDRAKGVLVDLDAKHAELERLARDECAGRAGPGLTAVPGEGGECLRNRAKADQFRVDNQIERLHVEQLGLEQKVTDLTDQVARSRAGAAVRIGEDITAKVEEKRANLVGVDILDQVSAMGRVADRDLFAEVAQWVLRLLLVALDCLPVLTKLMGGTTAYDEQVTRQLEGAKRLHDKHMHVHENRDGVDLEIQMRQSDRKLRDRIAAMTATDRANSARRRIDEAAEIDRLAAELERRGGR
ncbi:hypothetical protein UO65_5240 [Actinokineospora spheciospongiae]|uniref:DUF4407 domain-containing protein n=1 Tax=Actinokineospora spheciospongiae TaxID=909613 RepID=W7IS11_9PSEU|nr:hypothetical protein UO65_5240 [Actinokineospora spheciospongiae]